MTDLHLIAVLCVVAITAPALAFENTTRQEADGWSIDRHDVATTCGHSKQHRGPMFAARRDEVLARYGMSLGTHPDYEIDHLIPLCLGGSDDPSNLWPQPRRTIEPVWNAEAKDRLERLLCDMVCDGQLDITTAQAAIAKDWIAAYHKYYEVL